MKRNKNNEFSIFLVSASMKSAVWIWLVINTLLSLFCVLGVGVVLRDRNRQKSLYRAQLKEHVKQLESLNEVVKRLVKLENDQTTTKDWLTLLTEQINGLIDLFRKIERTTGDVGNGLETVKEILKILQSKQSTLSKLANLLASTKQLPNSR